MPRERFFRYAPSNYQLNKKIKKLQQDPELKFKDYFYGANVTTAPDEHGIFVCNATSSGIGATNRIGNEIRCTSLEIRGYVFINNLQTVVQKSDLYRVPMIRMIVFWDKSPNGQMPDIIGNTLINEEDCLLDNTNGADPIFCPYSRSTATRFRILYDKTYRFPQPTVVVSGGYVNPNPVVNTVVPHVYIQKKIKLSRVTRYSGPDDTFEDISENGLYIAMISTYDAASGDNYYITAELMTRINFFDD